MTTPRKKKPRSEPEQELPKGFNPDVNRKLFQEYVAPRLDQVYSLVSFYAWDKNKIDDLYGTCVMKLYRYVHHYDPNMSIDTWLHISVKRQVIYNSKMIHRTKEVIVEDKSDKLVSLGAAKMSGDLLPMSFVDSISDELLNALIQVPPLRLSVFLLYMQGYSLEEIVEIEFKNGHLEYKSKSIVKSRIFRAKIQLSEILKSHGYKGRKSTKNAGETHK